ncbi:MAG: polyprenyl synthetase family protein [Acidimicrobiales bacterium]
MPAVAAPSVVAYGLVRVEKALVDAVRTADEFVDGVSTHLIRAGGKRQRPAMAVAAAATGGAELVTDDVIRGGVAVELVQVGSLYHDDVIDEAGTRRDVESVNARWGNLVAILAGDFLLARASEMAAALGTEVAGLLAATIGRMTSGEMVEIRGAFDLDRSEESYLASIAGKTAALFSASARIGAIVAGLPRSEIDALTAYGQNYGMAFQIVDDILDVVATDEELGKPAGHDLVEGVYTLPILRTLANGSGAATELRRVLGRPLNDGNVAAARDLVRAGQGVGEAVAVAESYVRSAVATLDAVGQTEATAWLAATAENLLTQAAARA